MMEKIFCVALFVGFGAASMSAGNIDFQITPLGGASYEYNFILSGFTFQPQEELDIRFDPATYNSLSHGVAPNGFNVVLLQPNNPPGVFGDYTALAEIANPSTAGPFSVQVVYSGPGQPGSQPYLLEQFNSDGVFVDTLGAGFTTSVATTSDVPEPATFSLVSASLVLGSLWMLRRRRHPESERIYRSGYSFSITPSEGWRGNPKSSILERG
jgi:hypothetical protein